MLIFCAYLLGLMYDGPKHKQTLSHELSLSFSLLLLLSFNSLSQLLCASTHTHTHICHVRFGTEIKSQNGKIIDIYTFRYAYIEVGERFKCYLDQFMHMTKTVSILYHHHILRICFVYVFILWLCLSNVNERKNKQ